jgi:putative peptidoglycan lipid II flippase
VALAARFLLVFAPQVVLYGIGIVLTGVLQAHRRFAGPAIAPLLSSVVVAGAYLTFAVMGGSGDVDDLSRPAELVLGVGTTLGVVALTLSLLVPLRGLRLGLRPALRFPVGAAPRVRRLAVAGVLTLAGQQLVAAVAIRLAADGPDGTQVVYAAGLTIFLVPWAALAVPLATSAYPGLAERADAGDEPGYRRTLAPVAVLVVAASAVAAALMVAVAGPMARIFLASGSDEVVAALRDTIIAFAPGLPGYALVAVLTRALYARGHWKSPTVCVVGGWLLAVAADVVLAQLLPAEDRGLALGAGHSLGVTVAGLALLVAVARTAGPASLAGVGRVGAAAVAAGALAAVAGLWATQALDADPVPDGLLSAVLAGLLGAAIVLVIALAVMMGTARRPVAAAWRALRAAEHPVPAEPTDPTGARQEVHGD